MGGSRGPKWYNKVLWRWDVVVWKCCANNGEHCPWLGEAALGHQRRQCFTVLTEACLSPFTVLVDNVEENFVIGNKCNFEVCSFVIKLFSKEIIAPTRKSLLQG